MDKKPHFQAFMLGPRYWLTWFSFGLWWALAQLPFKFQMLLGALLGRLFYRFVKRRVAIARRNIELCFPDLSVTDREVLVKDNMLSLGKGFFEIGMIWFLPAWRLRRLYTLEGLEHLQAAEGRGQGVLLFAMHFTHLDLGGGAVCMHHKIDASYRSHKNPLYNWVQHRSRSRHNPDTNVIERSDVRTMLRGLKAGRAIWYAPDQDYGPKNSVFVPFFGITAATVTATSRFSRMTGAAVIPFTHHRRDDDSGYDIKIYPPMENFPSDDEQIDARRVNEVVERFVLEKPAQYLWAHRRFKSRPEGEADLYKSQGIAPSRRDVKKNQVNENSR